MMISDFEKVSYIYNTYIHIKQFRLENQNLQNIEYCQSHHTKVIFPQVVKEKKSYQDHQIKNDNLTLVTKPDMS